MKDGGYEDMKDLTGESPALRRETPEVCFVDDVGTFVAGLGRDAKTALAGVPPLVVREAAL